MRCTWDNERRERSDFKEAIQQAALTGLSNHYIVGNSGSVFVSCCALVHPLIVFNPLSADIHHQSPRVWLHVHIAIILDVKVGPISCPGETKEKEDHSHKNAGNFQVIKSGNSYKK